MRREKGEVTGEKYCLPATKETQHALRNTLGCLEKREKKPTERGFQGEGTSGGRKGGTQVIGSSAPLSNGQKRAGEGT